MVQHCAVLSYSILICQSTGIGNLFKGKEFDSIFSQFRPVTLNKLNGLPSAFNMTYSHCCIRSASFADQQMLDLVSPVLDI